MRFKSIKDMIALVRGTPSLVEWCGDWYHVIDSSFRPFDVKCEEGFVFARHRAVMFLRGSMVLESFRHVATAGDQYCIYMGAWMIYQSKRCKNPEATGQRLAARLNRLADNFLGASYDSA